MDAEARAGALIDTPLHSFLRVRMYQLLNWFEGKKKF